MTELMTVPEVRKELLILAMNVRAGNTGGLASKLEHLETQLHRRPQNKRGGTSTHASPPHGLIRQTAAEFPGETHAQLATRLGTTSARISVALHGKRGE